ncbi:2-dehydro-3-deoxy-phosphogluconate aldolase [Spirochaetia bacterium]|nr:2-dehydro-3-deoxy-phosphogluconate aldolase [Spirochaetia bacterium]
MSIQERISNTYLVPVVVIDDAARAVDTAKALLAGGVDIMEITLRTSAGLDAIAKVSAACPDVLVGAGTVLSLSSCKEAIAGGAQFIVSPGFDPVIVEYCLKNDIAVFPGCVTPTEITAAIKAGLRALKFFPANVYGGVTAIKALSGPFPEIKFIPTGGVDLNNLADYCIPEVFAVGGGWLCAGDYASMTQVCAQSAAIVKQHRGR